jgi:hypothetical protein
LRFCIVDLTFENKKEGDGNLPHKKGVQIWTLPVSADNNENLLEGFPLNS